MGTIECSQLASKSSWDSQDFGDISMVLKMAHFRKSTGPQWDKSSFQISFCEHMTYLQNCSYIFYASLYLIYFTTTFFI